MNKTSFTALKENESPAEYSARIERLHKAAPEMLEALQSMISYTDGGTCSAYARDASWRLVRAAVAKAGGE